MVDSKLTCPRYAGIWDRPSSLGIQDGPELGVVPLGSPLARWDSLARWEPLTRCAVAPAPLDQLQSPVHGRGPSAGRREGDPYRDRLAGPRRAGSPLLLVRGPRARRYEPQPPRPRRSPSPAKPGDEGLRKPLPTASHHKPQNHQVRRRPPWSAGRRRTFPTTQPRRLHPNGKQAHLLTRGLRIRRKINSGRGADDVWRRRGRRGGFV
jgi:hypothetical protein